MPRKTPARASSRAPARPVRRRTRRRRNRHGGFSFFLSALFVLALALAYFFFGDYLLPEREPALLSADGEIIVTFLDVGQGDSIVLRSDEHTVLIDAGEHRHRQVVLDYLTDAGVTRLDYVVATHPHSDHIGGLPPVLRDFEIGRLLMPQITNDTDTFENFLDAILNHEIETHFPVPGEVFRAGIIELVKKSPPCGQFSGINDNSIVLRMQHGQTSFLFTGDAETPSERWMTANSPNLSANVLKVGHHGSRTSTTEEFLSAVNPSIAVIQVGENNRFGHPHGEVIERLEARDISIFRTDQHGTIRMITDGQTISTP